jgi:hypothetical protein
MLDVIVINCLGHAMTLNLILIVKTDYIKLLNVFPINCMHIVVNCFDSCLDLFVIDRIDKINM